MKKIIATFLIISLTLISACSSKSSFITGENGHKQFKDKEGNFVKDGWAEISGDKYYFDLNGYLVTDKWVDNEYYVNKDGKMEKNYWYDDGNGTQYYLDESGKYVRDCIKNISGKEYAFNKDGLRVKNGVFVDSSISKGYYIDAQGNVDKESGYKNIGDTNCFVNESGEVIVNEWKEDDNKWYYYGNDGLMVKNGFVDGDFYVNENGEMVSNTELKIGDSTYVFNSDGHGKIKQERKVSFNELVNKYCVIDYDGKSFVSPYFTVSDDDSILEVEGMFRKLNITGLTSDLTYVPVDNATRIADVATSSDNILKSIGNINNALKFPSSVLTQIKNTSAKDGMKTVTSGGVTLTWTVNTSYGHNVNLHLTYTK